MLALAFALVCAAALVGSGLAIVYANGPTDRTPRSAIRVAHAMLGAGGLAVLLFALWRGPPPAGMGIAGFGVITGCLLALTLGVGLLLARASWRRRRPAAVLVGAHASLAVAGLVMLLALVALR